MKRFAILFSVLLTFVVNVAIAQQGSPVKKKPVVTISSTVLAFNERATITVEGYAGTYNVSSDNISIATVSGNTITANRTATGTATITVTAPETETEMAIDEKFVITVTNAGQFLTATPYFSNDNNPYCDDCFLHVSVRNNTSSSVRVKVFAELCSLDADNHETATFRVGGESWTQSARSLNTLNFDFSTLFDDSDINKKFRFKLYKNDTYSTPWNIQSIDFTYREKLELDYTLTDAGVGTLILPFNASLPESWKAYECVGIKNDTLHLAEANSLKHNVPYIITGTPQTVTFAGPKAIDDQPQLFGNYELKGTFKDNYMFADGDYVMQNQNDHIAFYKYTAGDWAATPYRAFIQLPSESTSKFAAISIPETDDVSTGIIAGNAIATLKPAGIYSADGAKRNGLHRGISIIVDEQGYTHKIFVNQ